MLTLDLLTTKTKRCFIDSYLHNLQFPFCSMSESLEREGIPHDHMMRETQVIWNTP